MSSVEHHLAMLKAAASNWSAPSTKDPNLASVMRLSTAQRSRGTRRTASTEQSLVVGKLAAVAVMPRSCSSATQLPCKHDQLSIIALRIVDVRAEKKMHTTSVSNLPFWRIPTARSLQAFMLRLRLGFILSQLLRWCNDLIFDYEMYLHSTELDVVWRRFLNLSKRPVE